MSNTVSEEGVAGLHGKRVENASLLDGQYESPDVYADQGDTRVIKDISFAYTVADVAQDGTTVIVTAEATRDTEVTVEQIGLIGLRKGEKYRSFYTTEELSRLRQTGSPAAPVAADANVSEMGEFELAEWLATVNPQTGREWTINEVLEKVSDDKDLATRMLQAENLRASNAGGDSRKGLEQGLTAVIQGE